MSPQSGNVQVARSLLSTGCYRLVAAAVALLCFFLADVSRAQSPQSDPPTIAIPDTRVGNQLRWVIDCLNGKDPGDLKDHFSDRFIELKGDEIKELLTQLRPQAFSGEAIRITRIIDDGRADTLSGEITAADTGRFLSVFLILDDAGKMAGLRFAPAGGKGARMGSWEEMSKLALKLPGEVSIGVYEMRSADGIAKAAPYTLKLIAQVNDDQRLAIGSTFKLYVLGALAEKLIEGPAKWDDPLAIREEWKSLPSGEMQNLKAGTEKPLRFFADKMISISDNTAADHLLHFTGRPAVEAYMARLNPGTERSFPFLSTRQMFAIKLAWDNDLRATYAHAKTAARTELLPQADTANLDLAMAKDWTEPIDIDRIEWFASAADCCRVIVDLHRLEQLPGMTPVGHALRLNPGVPIDKGVFPRIAYKGGSEPGVLNLTWFLERNDGRSFAISLGWNNAQKLLDEVKFIEIAQGVIKLLGEYDRPKPEAAPPGPAPAPATKE